MRPSSLVKKTLFVDGFTAGALMHHSLTAKGKVVRFGSGSGVGAITVSTSRISMRPAAVECGSICVAFGSRIATRFTPAPSAKGYSLYFENKRYVEVPV